MLVREHYEDRATWLSARSVDGRLGASESGVYCGVSPFMSQNELWELKTGRRQPKDLSGNAAVEQGVRLEPALRNLYAAMNPSYQIEYHAFDILYQKETPYIFCTLDGEVTDDNGRLGILEIKTATPSGKLGWEKWANGSVPQQYFSQLCHQLICTGYAFADLAAGLFNLSGDMTFRVYHFEREDCLEDMEWVLNKARAFRRYIEEDVPPPTLLTF